MPLLQFWNRWKTEYLTSLREFHKKTGNNSTIIRIGDIVQIHDENRRIMWKTGIVENLTKGNDGLVRSAIIRTKNGTTSRPIVKLYPLELFTDIETSKDKEARQKKEPSATTSRILTNREATTKARENIKKWTK